MRGVLEKRLSNAISTPCDPLETCRCGRLFMERNLPAIWRGAVSQRLSETNRRHSQSATTYLRGLLRRGVLRESQEMDIPRFASKVHKFSKLRGWRAVVTLSNTDLRELSQWAKTC